jgi:hypothetical protein
MYDDRDKYQTSLRSHKNTFVKGMVIDPDITYSPSDAYKRAVDLRLTVSNNGTMGALENIKGNVLLDTDAAGDLVLGTIVGSVAIDNDLILWTVLADTSSRMYRITFTGETINTCTEIYSDFAFLGSTDDMLLLSTSYPVKAISRKESTDIEKVYWVDGNNNYLRFANLGNNAAALKEDGSYVSAKKFGIVANVKFTMPIMTSITSGGLNVGMVQYSYQLYNKNGAETAFAPATGLHHIVSTSENLSSSYGYKGNESGDESGKTYNFTLDLPDNSYEYDYIRVVSIHYTTYGQLPTISIIVEKPIGTNGVVTFSDTGSGYIGTYTPEQFTMLSHLYKAGDIESNKNYLFLANITEDFFDIGTYDARAYRFSATETRAHHYESDGHIYALDKGATFGTWRYGTLVGQNFTVEASGSSLLTIPSDADLLNYYNDSSLDGTRTGNQELKYKADGTTLGGQGVNVSYTFGTSYLYPDDGSSTWKIETTTRAYNPEGTASLGYSGYYTPNITAGYKSYELDETYRFGIVFTDRYGRDSVVNWIGDIRMPSISDLSPYFANYDGSGTYGGYGNYIKTIAPIFTVSAYPTDAVSYKIVRVDRTDGDKSIVCSGLLRPTQYRDVPGEDYSCRQPLHLYNNDDIDPTNHVKYDMHEFISPEISFYKSLQVLGNDYIQVHNVENTNIDRPLVRNLSSGVDNDMGPLHANIKYRRVKPNPGGRVVLTILEGKIVGIMESIEMEQFTDLKFYGYYNNTLEEVQPEQGYKGTSLIIRTAPTDVYGVAPLGNNYSYMYTKYGVYRRNIYAAQYGGNTFSDRSNNEYIAASKTVTIPVARTSSAIEAGMGDMFVHFHEHMALYQTGDDASNVFLNFMFPVSTSINLALRYDDRVSTIYNGTSTSLGYRDLREEGNIEKNYSEMYLYNTVYSQSNNLKKYFPLPANEDFEATESFSTRIIVSEKKINGEITDSWLQFLTNNFIDVDANYGSITNILSYNNNLLYWQPKGFGTVDVNPRSILQDTAGAALVVGSGDLLTRFDYVSTLTGNSDKFSLINAVKGVYWYDSINRTINRFSGESIERLSKIKGIQSYLNDERFATAIAGYDVANDEVLFTLAGTDTICFNEAIDGFTSFYSFVPTRYININNKLITSGNDSTLYIHSDVAHYGVFYGAAALPSTLNMLVNPDIDYAKTFDIINFQSYSYNGSLLNYSDTFNTVQCYTSYQNSGVVAVTSNGNIERKIGMWSLAVPRNIVETVLDENSIDITANLNPNKTYKERMRDTHMYTELTYNNTNNYRFVLPYVKTKYRISHR